jgi:hypothetical protein
MSVTVNCPHCGDEYTLGVDGTVDGCDECLGITRAVNGYAIDEEPLTVIEEEG